MKVTIEEVRRIAQLARLEFDEDEERELSKDLTGILDYMDKLKEVEIPEDFDLDSLSVQYPVVPLREDEVSQSLDRGDALASAQDTKGEYFTVPKVIRKKKD